MDQALAKVFYDYFLIVTLHKVELWSSLFEMEKLVSSIRLPTALKVESSWAWAQIFDSQNTAKSQGYPAYALLWNHCFLLPFSLLRTVKKSFPHFTVHRGEETLSQMVV